MKKTEIQNAVLNGQRILVAQFRDWELKSFPSKTSNEPANLLEVYYCIGGRDAFTVEHFVPRGTKAEDVKRPAYNVGETVVVRWSDWTVTRWGTRAHGSVEPLTP